jgi:DNA-binding response OmpR family regulator
MRRILVVDDDRHTRLAMDIWLKQCGFWVAITDGGERMAHSLGATRRLRKPFRPATLLGVIDVCLSEAEQRRKHAAALATIASAPPNISRERANTG